MIDDCYVRFMEQRVLLEERVRVYVIVIYCYMLLALSFETTLTLYMHGQNNTYNMYFQCINSTKDDPTLTLLPNTYISGRACANKAAHSVDALFMLPVAGVGKTFIRI